MDAKMESSVSPEAGGMLPLIVASCDESGITTINEEASINSINFEDGPVEVTYINVDEDSMLAEFANLNAASNYEDSSAENSLLGFENDPTEDYPDYDFTLEPEAAAEGGLAIDLEQKKVVTNDYFEGKLSFHEFLAIVEGSEDEKSESEDDESDDDSTDSSSGEDPDYQPKKLKPKSSKPSQKKAEVKQVKKAVKIKETKEPEKPKDKRVEYQKGRRKGQKVVKRLPPALQGLMGEANLRFARGETQDAVQLCMEVVRQAPTFPEPFRTLSMLYEEAGDYVKSHQLALIAAHLSPQDADEWLRLAEVCLDQNDSVQASKCLAKAAHADPSNLEIHQKRCELLVSMDSHKELLRACLTMLRYAQPENADGWMELATSIARIHHAHGHLTSARRALSNALQQCSTNFTMEHYNLLFELQIATKRYFDVVKVLHMHCGVVFDRNVADEDDLEQTTTITLTTDLPLDIQSKLCVSLIHLKRLDLVDHLMETLSQCSIDDYGDIHLDIAEAYMDSGFHQKAVDILETLIISEKYGLAAVWLRYADCLFALDRMEDSIVAFRRVITLAPLHQEARIQLSDLLLKLGRSEEALEAVTQDCDAVRLEATLLHHRCLLLLQEQRWDQFVQAFKLLLSRHAKNIRSRDEVYKACGAKRIGWESDEESADEEREYGTSSIEAEEEYRLLRLAAQYLLEKDRLVELERLCFMALTSPLFRKKMDILRQCRFLTLQVCMLKGDSYYAYNLARSLLLSNLKNNLVWNLFIQVVMRGDDSRHNRFLMRLMVKHPDNLCISVLNGHACLAAGTYKYSLNEYMSAYKQDPTNPFLALLNGIVLVQMTCQKFSSGKHSLVTQACAFFDSYLRSRGAIQETYYNLGRAMHQLGILPAAIHYYEQGLACKPSVTQGRHAHVFDLSREIAYNLSLIYRSSGANDVARMYLNKYICL